ncbi:hypothetical protein BGX20_008319 [Mortierella sp. AD010]|nr:hypothetical protein BGX20_008319 [Mortierella sp. AD010]
MSPTTVDVPQELTPTPHELSAAVSFSKSSPHMTRIPDVKVCGFHMHALEWHTMQNLGTQEQITLTERAQCPIFNLSVTRWLNKGANNLQKKPFNSIKCHCGDPMVVAPDMTPADQGGYDLVCPKTLSAFNDLSDKDNTLRRQKYRSIKDHTKSSSGNEQSKPQNSQRPCSKVIKMCEVMYPPLSEPVHTFIPNDEWLDRCFSSRPTRRSYYLPNHGPQRKNRKQSKSSLINTMTYYPMDYSKFRMPPSRQRKPNSVSFNFKPDIITGCVSPRSTSPSRQHSAKDDPNEWPIPDWVEQSMTISDAILNSDKNSFVNLWGGENISDLDKWRVFELDEDVLSHSIKEALEDANEYSDQYMKKVKTRLEEHREKQRDIDIQLQKLNFERAKMAKEIKEMDKNSLEMTHKCRVCYERVLTHAVLPCYHLVMCGSCASIVNECIVCRVRKTGLQQIRWG